MPRKWLETLLTATEESEAPERYFWWSGLCAISATLRKKVFLQRGPFYKLYPNIYVALVSERSGLKKGVPIALAKDLVERLDSVRVISGCSSIQGLIKELSMQQTFASGTVISEAQGLMVSEEFESFLTGDPKELTYLTALQGTHEHEKSWKKRLRNSPLEELKSPCLTLLVASNEILFKSMVRQKDFEGGFIARTFIVYETKVKRVNDLLYSEEELGRLIKENECYTKDLMERLGKVVNLSGEMKLSPLAVKTYRSWYEQLSNSGMDDVTGTYSRLGDQVLKVAMLISASEEDDLVITEGQLSRAIFESERCLPGVRAVSLEKERAPENVVIEKVMKELLRAPNQEITRRALLINTHIDVMAVDRALDTLVQRGAIYEPKRNSKREIFYKMTEETYSRYVKFKIAEGGN